MKTTFAAAAVAGLVVAKVPLGKLKNNPAFVKFISENNRNYRSVHEINMRAETFADNMEKITELNVRSHKSGKSNAANYGVGIFTDLTDAEFQTRLGFQEPADGNRTKLYHKNRVGRVGVVNATTVDHVKDGFMGPVKNQGNCGSCWAFAANSALEGNIAKANNASPVHLSEQHLVDCTLNNARNMELFGEDYNLGGCNGGWMASAWYFQYKQGAMKESDYEYTSGRTGRETACAHDKNKTVGKVTNWSRIRQSDGIDGIKDALKTTPLTIAVNASSGVFQHYQSGVVGANDGCPTGINHAVVIVGYTEAGDGDDGDDSDDDSGPDPQPEPPAGCNVTKWWHSCNDDGRRMLQDSNGYENYWKIQNSWSSGWGDEGFILFEIAEGKGVCGMNQYVEYAQM